MYRAVGTIFKARQNSSGRMLAIKEMEVKGSQITVIVTEMHIMKSSSSDFVVDYVGAFRRGPRLLWVCFLIGKVVYFLV